MIGVWVDSSMFPLSALDWLPFNWLLRLAILWAILNSYSYIFLSWSLLTSSLEFSKHMSFDSSVSTCLLCLDLPLICPSSLRLVLLFSKVLSSASAISSLLLWACFFSLLRFGKGLSFLAADSGWIVYVCWALEVFMIMMFCVLLPIATLLLLFGLCFLEYVFLSIGNLSSSNWSSKNASCSLLLPSVDS